jgi:hypothetical protein
VLLGNGRFGRPVFRSGCVMEIRLATRVVDAAGTMVFGENS